MRRDGGTPPRGRAIARKDRSTILAFAAFEIDLEAGELRCDGRPVAIQPLIFDLLVHFARHPHALRTKGNLIDDVWKGTIVSDGAITQAVSLLRRVLRSADGSPPPVRTVWGRGYRFTIDVWSRRDGEQAPASDGRRPAGEPPFVGRADLMALLRRVLAEASAGASRVVLLSGEPGIGKTRACNELAALAAALGARVFAAHVPEGAPPLWPWAELRRRAVAADAAPPPVDWNALATAAAPPAHHNGGAGSVAPDERAHHRFGHFEGVASFWAGRAAAGPLVLVIDDAHRADAATLELADFVADRLAHAPLLIVAALRSAGVRSDAGRARAIGALARRPDATAEQLRGLAKDDVAEWVTQTTGRPCDDAEATALLDRSGGNPYLLKETLRAPGPPDAAAGVAALPATVLPAIERHLEALSPDCRTLLVTAAVLGRVFDAPVLAAVRGAAVTDVLVLVEEAVHAEVVTAVPSGRFRFVHGLVHEALYATLGAARRIAVHARAADAIEEIYGAGDEQLAALAHHCAAAATGGTAARALLYGERAARVAERACAFRVAMAHYRRALELARLAQAGEEVLLRLQVALAEAAANVGDFATVRREARHALRRARRLDDAAAFARAAHAFSLGGDSDPPDARTTRLLEEALARHGAEGPLGGRLLTRLVDATWLAGPPDASRALAEQAVEAGRRSGDPDVLAIALTRAYRVLQGAIPALEARPALARELADLLPAVRGPAARLACRWHLLGDAVERGDRLVFDQRVDALLREAGDSPHPFAPWYAAAVRTVRLHLDGRLADAEREARCGATLVAPHDAAFRSHVLALQLSGIRLAQGRLAEHVDELRLHVTGDEAPAWRAHLALGEALRGFRERGDVALSALLADDLAAVRRDANWLATLVVLAELAIALRRPDAATALFPYLHPFEAHHATFGAAWLHHGSVARRLGLLAELCGQGDDAIRLVRSGLERDRRMGAPVFVALGRYEYARLLRRFGGRAARGEVQALCDGLLVETARLGLSRLRADVEALRD